MKRPPLELTVRTEKIVHGGQALARDDRFVVFVDDALPNETVRTRIYKKKKKFAFGRAIEVLEASPDRVDPDCPWAGDCGGCTFRHATYAAQLRFKKEVLVEALYGIANAQELVSDVVPAEAINDYRNKMVFSFGTTLEGELVLGLHRRGSFIHILPADICKLQSAASREIVRRVTALAKEMGIPAFHEIKKTPGLRTLTIREARGTGQRLVELLSTSGDDDLAARLVTELDDLADTISFALCTNVNGPPRPEQRAILKGPGYIEEILNGLRFRIDPDTFFQSNTAQAERLFTRVRELATRHGRPTTALDLFAGTGPIALHLASIAERVIGVESFVPSVEAARANLALNGIENVDLIAADVNKALPPGIPDKVDLIVVDPPRPGLSPEAITWINRLNPDTVVYVSCNPATLARDLKLFLQAPYTIEAIEPFDLFPYTYHVESLVLLRRTTEPSSTD
ncbi:MAG: 23S rRNA (uracil(1939)-C(5))-methyltransferase RlmD [Kiritimatiellia bacterium]|jgi:23S rRNA (uracil1939-C5)-methyltransferase|nr:23S rRNA (uracil(1939)-C(5))-methyltransferase RlmD [Kiritimatiellia bacterium]